VSQTCAYPFSLFQYFAALESLTHSYLSSFFLAIDILQFFPKFATISPGLVILPLLVIILLTAAKDGYEDVKRHQADRAVNHAEVDVLDGGGFVNPNVMGPKSRTFTPGIPKALRRKKRRRSDVDEGAPADQITAEEEKERGGGPVDTEHAMRVQLPPVAISSPPSEMTAAPNSPRIGRQPTRRFVRNANGQTATSDGGPGEDDEPRWLATLWEDLKVGDFVRLRCDEQVPADIVLCATSEPENVAYVETKNLDGETNLKSRNAVPELTHFRSAHAILANRGASGRFRIRAEAPDVNMYKFNAAVVLQQEDDEEKANPIDLQMTLLRGTVLRNTDWAIGVVLFTGGDSKIVLNSGNTPSKRSRVERQMNPMVSVALSSDLVDCAS
jgi:phospholipid-translocating ATPase